MNDAHRLWQFACEKLKQAKERIAHLEQVVLTGAGIEKKLKKRLRRALRDVATLNKRLDERTEERNDARGHAHDTKAVWTEAYAKLKAERDQAEQEYSDLIHLCEQMLKEYDNLQAVNDYACSDDQYGTTPELTSAVEAIRNHVSPGNKDS